MMIQCDDIVRKDVKSYQIMKDLEDCSDYELSVIHEVQNSRIYTSRLVIFQKLRFNI